MEERVLELLQEKPNELWKRLDIFRTFPDEKLTKSEQNSVLYKLKTKGLVDKIANSNGTEPKWFLSKTAARPISRETPAKTRSTPTRSSVSRTQKEPQPKEKCSYCGKTGSVVNCNGKSCGSSCCSSDAYLCFFTDKDFDDDEDVPEFYPMCLECYRLDDCYQPDKARNKNSLINRHSMC